jgi:predicted methyltransferase
MATVHADDVTLETAASGSHRSPTNIARNTWRHPVETLEFFGIRPDMTVVEIWPGSGGWYTEVLAPYLRARGTLIAANYDGSTGVEYFAKGAQAFRDKLAAMPDVYDRVEVTALMPPAAPQAAPAGSADLVVTFRNLHNWVRDGLAEGMFQAMFEVLKPGGTLGLVAHRGSDDMTGPEAARTGYLAESEAIRLAEAAGFQFVARSEINANPNDTRDHPEGVWTLPPNFRAGDVDRDKYAAIGESDRMTLKFRKP